MNFITIPVFRYILDISLKMQNVITRLKVKS
jgi:hypothetical protein